MYLIGGAPKCGKTTLAKQLSRSAGIPWVSTDTLQNVIKPYFPKEEFDEKFPASSMRYSSNDEKYAKNTFTEVITAYREQSKILLTAIAAFIDSEITDGNDYIIEGYHIEPSQIAALAARFHGQIRSVILIKEDASAFIHSMHKSTTPNDWIISKTKDDTTFPKIATMVVEYSALLKSEAIQRDIKIISTDGDFARQLKKAEEYMLELPKNP